ncbi:MAG TPA: glycosyltransferase family 4 protein [Vicinamibacterales bacterium]|nr:glycosyltransferase family 4 protein [Vicinamibacterales bacterium]
MKIAFVVQRYGAEIVGGSEYHCRLVAERLAERHEVDVVTTCARDYITWANEYPEGADRLRGVTVRRFSTSRTRDLAAFNRYSDWIFNTSHSRGDEMEWLKQQGPWSPGLIEYLERHQQQYDVLVFFTYLYAPTVLGIRVAPSKSLLVPTAHDEPALGLGIYEDVFSSAAAFAWNTDSERRMITSRFHLRALVEDVVGCGVDFPEGDVVSSTGERLKLAPSSRETLAPHLEGPANAFRRRHRIYNPFLLYGGRIDPGKGCEELLEYFQTYVNEGGDASLLLMGTKLMPLPDDPRVRFAGMLPDDERLHALEAATVVVVPSPYESLSLLALEAFAVGTPVLANARAEVLVEHCLRSNAGLFYADRWEFVEALKLLMKDAALRQAMGENGKAYIHRHYRWTTILHKYERIFSRMGGHTPVPPPRPPHRPRDRDRPREVSPARESRRPAASDGHADRQSRGTRDRRRRGGPRRDRPRDARSRRS